MPLHFNRHVACKVELVVSLGTDEHSDVSVFFSVVSSCEVHALGKLPSSLRINTGLVLADYTIGLPGPF